MLEPQEVGGEGRGRSARDGRLQVRLVMRLRDLEENICRLSTDGEEICGRHSACSLWQWPEVDAKTICSQAP